jgi:hypothetical protein
LHACEVTLHGHDPQLAVTPEPMSFFTGLSGGQATLPSFRKHARKPSEGLSQTHVVAVGRHARTCVAEGAPDRTTDAVHVPVPLGAGGRTRR